MNKIELATKIAWSYIGTPYIWGGDDPMAGFDCSGFVIEILKSVGELPSYGDWTAQQLYERFVEDGYSSKTKEGFLVFWHSSNNKDKIIHVEYCLDSSHSIGASGGGSDNYTIGDAIADNAYVKIRPFNLRPYIYGFVDPFEEDR